MLDRTDRSILSILQEDAKLSVKTIAGKLGLTKTPVYERIRRLEKEGYIKKYVALVDKKKISPHVTAFVSASVEVKKAEHLFNLSRELCALEEVVELYHTGGTFDILLKVVTSDLEAYHEFSTRKLAGFPHIGRIHSTFVLHEAKYQTAFPLLDPAMP